MTPCQTPAQCASLAEIRQQIDAIDHHVIQLLGERFGHVKAAAPFKQDQQAVRAPQRLEAMLQQRQQWAAEAGLAPAVIGQLYRQLVAYFIAEEMRHWQAAANPLG
ncbi:isochorismate lyase [Vogesella oryzae]|uniref:isochorismate lyase n=1 Tax=Vogesella oryzae TaxID=1735285 RepID=UPI0015832D45|nr:isochorismate lyase [Vogesella oryzae]